MRCSHVHVLYHRWFSKISVMDTRQACKYQCLDVLVYTRQAFEKLSRQIRKGPGVDWLKIFHFTINYVFFYCNKSIYGSPFCWILSLLTAIKGCISEFGLFALDEHFQANRLLIKYWYKNVNIFTIIHFVRFMPNICESVTFCQSRIKARFRQIWKSKHTIEGEKPKFTLNFYLSKT